MYDTEQLESLSYKPECKTCNDTRIKYILDKRYKTIEYAPPEAITKISCPDCKPIKTGVAIPENET